MTFITSVKWVHLASKRCSGVKALLHCFSTALAVLVRSSDSCTALLCLDCSLLWVKDGSFKTSFKFFILWKDSNLQPSRLWYYHDHAARVGFLISLYFFFCCQEFFSCGVLRSGKWQLLRQRKRCFLQHHPLPLFHPFIENICPKKSCFRCSFSAADILFRGGSKAEGK